MKSQITCYICLTVLRKNYRLKVMKQVVLMQSTQQTSPNFLKE